ncbi:hypothetical protein [Methanobrevibacter olleyae]|uniref:Uncharacterized protein n=1 Tax=Methanobrevibacter olleyae TaxID=294671 RepID=A0A126R2K3_METOL|nr:hypothetical protein [Methanobrevibacter olleyae]AMK16302.1 hypothetical protein YLM1_1747 [Methanobrevibacter olleyae]
MTKEINTAMIKRFKAYCQGSSKFVIIDRENDYSIVTIHTGNTEFNKLFAEKIVSLIEDTEGIYFKEYIKWVGGEDERN